MVSKLEPPLSDVKVLDLTQSLAGPYCTKLLADYGADVLKLEPPGEGDPARRLGPFPNDVPHHEKSGTFLLLNTNKRGVTLNLSSQAGAQILRELVKDADILVESFPPGTMERLGLDYQSLAQINPTLVMTSITNFGQTGPYKEYKLTEIVLYGMGGAMYSTGLPERYPLKLYGTVSLFHGGHVAAVATMAAFYGARHRGIGQHVDVSLFDTAAGSIDRRMGQLLIYEYSGQIASREPNLGIGFPSGVYPCLDGYIVITGGRQYFPRTAQMMDMPELAEDPRFGSIEGQADYNNKEEFETTIFYPWVLQHTKREIMEKGQDARVFCTALNAPEDLLKDPHFESREYFVEVTHPVAGAFKYPGAPYKMSESPWGIRRPAPMLGEHNEEVYCSQLSYSKVELVILRELGII